MNFVVLTLKLKHEILFIFISSVFPNTFQITVKYNLF